MHCLPFNKDIVDPAGSFQDERVPTFSVQSVLKIYSLVYKISNTLIQYNYFLYYADPNCLSIFRNAKGWL